MKLLPAAALAAAALLPDLALADRPATLPTRDVAVTYRTLGNQPREVRAAWSAGRQRLRVEMPGQGPAGSWALVDPRAGRADLVLDSQRLVTPAPAGQEQMTRYLRMMETAQLTREGTARYAGQSCTNWRWRQGNDSGRACLTQDGVALRASDDRGQGVEATSVAYGAQDPSRFAVPPGYRNMDLGEMMRGLGLGMPRR